MGEERPGRTWQNLLQDQHDEALFAALLTSEVQHFGMGGKGTAVLEADLIASVTPSPDGKHLLVTTLEQPFSRTVPASRFARRIEVVDLGGTVEHTVARLPVADAIPIAFGSVRTGPRGVTWRSDAPATLAWVEALDGGDAGQPADKRDVVRVLEAPFTGTPRDIWRTELRYGGIDWGDGETAIASEWWYDDRRSRVWHIQPDGDGPPRELFDLNYQDAYADPGDPVSRMGPYGWYVLHRTSAGEILLQGRGASPEGVYPFLDAMDLDTLVTRRLWQSADPYYETLSRVLDDDGKRLITRRQSQREPPNYGIRTGKKWSPLTRFQDWAPQLAGLQKQIVTTTRGDGVELSATLYTPPGYKARRDGPLPTVFWAYPREHKSKKTASQITSSENTFSRPGRASVLFLLTQGYAVLSGPTMPIVGEGDAEPNDTYVEQLVASARAHVDNVVDMGVADRERLAIGGHSYGAFTTANLLAHSDLFRAGIARSGAYNRTLTPFGFQGEQRTYWEAMPVYQRMSPFMAAPSIDEPLLMLHGADDSNSGTYPIQSERLYSAIKGHGGTVRWVELPYEDHGYRSREGVGHALWEMVTWLDAHVKNAGPRGE